MSQALLQAGNASRLQIMFDPAEVAGRCADGFTPSGQPLQDLDALARLGGFQVTPVGKGLLALVRPSPASTVELASRPSVQSFAPRDDAVALIREVVVTGRPVRPPSSEEHDSVPLISTISAGEISRLPAANIVDAVTVLPGVSAYADMGLGQAATGNREFITVRGFDSSYNAYELNGVATPQSDPNSRALSLKMLPAFSVQAVSVVKTPTAELEDDAIGGVVDIRTPTAFDFAGDLNRINLRGSLSDLALQTGLQGGGGAIQPEFARRFLGGALGVYATVYHDLSNSVAESGEVGSWVPTYESQAGLTNYAGASSLSATEYKYDFYTNKIEAYGGNISVDYRQGRNTAYFKFTASSYDDQGTDSQMSVRHGLANTGVNAAGQVVDFWGRPVGPGLPGDPAYAPQQVSQNPNWPVGGANYNAQGVYDPNGINSGNYFQLRDQLSNLFTAQFGGRSEIGRFAISYDISYGYSLQARPNYLEASFYGTPIENGRVQIDWTNSYTPKFVFNSPTSAARIFNQSSSALWKFQGTDSASGDAMASVKINASYHVHEGGLETLHAGLQASQSDRSQYLHNLFGDDDGNFTLLTPLGYASPFWAAAGPTVNEQPGRNISGSFLNFPGQFRVFSRNGLLSYVEPYLYRSDYAIDPNSGLKTWPNPGSYTQNDYYGGSADSRENVYSAYASSDFVFGAVSIYLGLRYELTSFAARYWVDDTTDDGHFASASQAYGELSPTFNLVWRPDERLVYRAAFRRSFSRPAMSLLAGPATVSDDGVITKGNPNLRPTTALNYDASVSYYGEGGAQFEFAAFRKTLSRFVYAALVTGSAPEANFGDTLENGVTYSQPENGRSAWLEGVEAEARRQFGELPGPLSGLGLSTNATFQRSDATNGRPDHYGRKTWLPRAPRIAYSIDLSWADTRFRTDLVFQYTGLQLVNLTSYNVDNFLQPSSVLDWSAAVDLGRFKLGLSVKNLMGSPDFWKTLGESKRYLGVQDGDGNGSYVITGRVASMTLTTAW